MKRAVLLATTGFAGIALLMTLAACAAPAPRPSVTTLKANIENYTPLPVDWDPSHIGLWIQPLQAVYESLIYLDPATVEWKPLLAEEFEVSEDLRSMRVKLREDVEFTDGTHLDGEGAKVALDYALSADSTHAVLVQQFAPRVEVTGEYELEIATTGAMTDEFLFWLGLVPIASPTAIEDDPEGLVEDPVGSGPYVIAEMVPEVSMSFVRNESYRDPDAFAFDELEFYVMADSIAVANALKSGQLNAGVVESAYATDLENQGLALHLGTASTWYLLWQDPTGSAVPQLADSRVRQAIAYSFDRESIIENLENGYGSATSQMWGEGSPYHVDGADDTYAYDPVKARELLAEAGYAGGFEVTIPSHAFMAKYEPIVQQALADIGIAVTYDKFADFADWFEATKSGDYGLTFRGTSDIFFNGALRYDVADGGFPRLNEQFETIDNGERDESQAAEGRVGEIVLEEALAIVVSRPAAVWASIPGIDVSRSIIQAPMPLSAIQLAD